MSYGSIPRLSLNTRQTSETLGVTVQTLAKWRCRGEGPPFSKVNSMILYRIESLDQFLREREQGGGRGK
ncbi:helix-turn-helix domain-containing protein [Nesterenkonia lutea]|uniref:helix-turn-helix domain-containing protein n=1 Tax=Nesterenkonia lutea TaxID=272919 RepID=UPI003376BCCF